MFRILSFVSDVFFPPQRYERLCIHAMKKRWHFASVRDCEKTFAHSATTSFPLDLEFIRDRTYFRN